MDIINCNGCGVDYDSYEDGFHKNSSNPHGYNYRCKYCVNKKIKKNKELRYEKFIVQQQFKDFIKKGERKGSMMNKTVDKILVGISNLRFKYTWSESGYGWMNSKERISINQYKLINKEDY